MNIPLSEHTDLAAGWRWTNSFATLGTDFYSPMATQPMAQPHWVGVSGSAAKLLGLTPEALQTPDWLNTLVGNQTAPGSQPLSSVYSGHQFGVWAGQLAGDSLRVPVRAGGIEHLQSQGERLGRAGWRGWSARGRPGWALRDAG
mgnify:CR=1 FL=1